MNLSRHISTWLWAWGMALAALLFGLALAGSAHATERSGAYVEAFGGYVWPGNIGAGGEGNPELRVTLERSGKYTFGAGAGYQFADGINIGGKIRYERVRCVTGCDALYEGPLQMAELGILGTAGYTFDTGRIKPFVEADLGYGYVAMVCKGKDGCPGTELFPNVNLADAGLMWGFCGGWKAAVSARFDLIADACWHRVEGVTVTRPHWDAPDSITAGARLRYRL